MTRRHAPAGTLASGAHDTGTGVTIRPKSRSPRRLSAAQQAEFARQGYVIVPDVLPVSELAALDAEFEASYQERLAIPEIAASEERRNQMHKLGTDSESSRTLACDERIVSAWSAKISARAAQRVSFPGHPRRQHAPHAIWLPLQDTHRRNGCLRGTEPPAAHHSPRAALLDHGACRLSFLPGERAAQHGVLRDNRGAVLQQDLARQPHRRPPAGVHPHLHGSHRRTGKDDPALRLLKARRKIHGSPARAVMVHMRTSRTAALIDLFGATLMTARTAFRKGAPAWPLLHPCELIDRPPGCGRHVRFSVAGTLLATAATMVSDAPAGHQRGVGQPAAPAPEPRSSRDHGACRLSFRMPRRAGAATNASAGCTLALNREVRLGRRHPYRRYSVLTPPWPGGVGNCSLRTSNASACAVAGGQR